MTVHSQQTWPVPQKCRPLKVQLPPATWTIYTPDVTSGLDKIIKQRILELREVWWVSTLSSMVSNLVSKIPSINLELGVAERSANFCKHKCSSSNSLLKYNDKREHKPDNNWWQSWYKNQTWLNFESWSTASFPTRASPTNKTRSGLLRLISFESALINGSLSWKASKMYQTNTKAKDQTGKKP